MGRGLVAALAGSIFGFGLALSGMMDPARVRGFLDIFGEWDPTLAFVMGGASGVMAFVWIIQRRMAAPLAEGAFHVPAVSAIDARLIGGAALFGVGWGLAGLCPGPAIASLATQFIPALVFVIAMIVGMAAYRLLDRRKPDTH
jgi:uncharacterized membrane protein YedE/YeeE